MRNRNRRALVLSVALVVLCLFSAGPADAAPRWHAQSLVGASDVVGPLVAQTPGGSLVAAYAVPQKNGLYALSFRVLRSSWSKPVAVGTTSSPKGGVTAIAANNARVATVTGLPSAHGVRYTVREFTLGGRRLFTRTIAGGEQPVVAIDASNIATVILVTHAARTSSIQATTYSATGRATARNLETINGGADDSVLGSAKVAAVGAYRLAAAWVVYVGSGYGPVHTALLSRGRWGKTSTLAATGRTVSYVGLAGNGHLGLLDYTVATVTASGSSSLRAVVNTNGSWVRNRVVDSSVPNHVAIEGAQAVAHSGSLATVMDRVFTLGAKASSWRAGPAIPKIKTRCGGTFNTSAYRVNTLHYFAVSAAGSRCVLVDYRLS